MFLTITTSKATLEQFQEVETFLHEFLPRLKQQPGVLAMYHYARPEQEMKALSSSGKMKKPSRPTEQVI